MFKGKVIFAKLIEKFLNDESKIKLPQVKDIFQADSHLQDIGKLTFLWMVLLTEIDCSPITGTPRNAPGLEQDSGKVQVRSHTMVLMTFTSRLAQPKTTSVLGTIALSEIRNKKSTLHEYFSRKL